MAINSAGEGMKEELCSVCNGTGKVESPEWERYDAWMNCPNCQVEPEATIEDCVEELLRQASKALKSIGPNHPLYGDLHEAVINVEEFFQTDDPVQNGWVGSDGLP